MVKVIMVATKGMPVTHQLVAAPQWLRERGIFQFYRRIPYTAWNPTLRQRVVRAAFGQLAHESWPRDSAAFLSAHGVSTPAEFLHKYLKPVVAGYIQANADEIRKAVEASGLPKKGKTVRTFYKRHKAVLAAQGITVSVSGSPATI